MILNQRDRLDLDVYDIQRQHVLSNMKHDQYRNHSFEHFFQINSIFSRLPLIFVSAYHPLVHLNVSQLVAYQP